MTVDELARKQRAAERAKGMLIRKGRLGEPELDFSPVRGGAAISLATRLTVESFSLAGISTAPRSRDVHVRFVPRRRA